MLNVTKDQIPECELLQYIAERCGAEAAWDVWQRFKGAQIYVPEKLSQAQREAVVLKNFNGKNVRVLARETGLSDRAVYAMLSRKKTTNGDLFDDEQKEESRSSKKKA
jgi:Mor family transcriptional regulator